MSNDAAILKAVEALAVDQFSREAIEGVRARRDLDGDGDPIIWIDVLMRDGVMPLDPKVTLPFRSTIREAVRDLGETAHLSLPSIRYPSTGGFALRPPDLIATARKLTRQSGTHLSDSDLRRSISSAYYALFHTLAGSAADFLVKTCESKLARQAWSTTYRALDHATLKRACSNQSLLRRLPKALKDSADLLLDMQSRRHQADYDPLVTFSVSEVTEAIDACEAAIAAFVAADESDRRAFVAFALFRSR